jgi:hypothetical protein
MSISACPRSSSLASLKYFAKPGRATLSLSKWAKRVLKRGLEKQDEGTRAAIAEQLHLNTLLSRKIHSMNESSSNDESSSEDDDNAEITLRSEITNVENSGALPMSIPFPYQKLNNVDGGHYQHQRQEQSKEARGGSEAALGLRNNLGVW